MIIRAVTAWVSIGSAGRPPRVRRSGGVGVSLAAVHGEVKSAAR
jgi:hypothetical protein